MDLPSWYKQISEAIRIAVGQPWRTCIIPGLKVLDLQDGSWLRLEPDMLHLFPGSSKRIEMVWFPRQSTIEEMVDGVMKKA
jgi:hypothetical protein